MPKFDERPNATKVDEVKEEHAFTTSYHDNSSSRTVGKELHAVVGSIVQLRYTVLHSSSYCTIIFEIFEFVSVSKILCNNPWFVRVRVSKSSRTCKFRQSEFELTTHCLQTVM